ncbi:MAG: hypothetical protein HFK08_04320 [Clostridia bacterium]|jgi:fido (protein-threonine AMPylation protein)|nr:hypothetical protein [Clostridia bacterium]
MQQQADITIKNAAAILSAVNMKPSPKAVKDAAAALIERKDTKSLAKRGSESNRLFFRVISALTKPCESFDTQALLKLHGFIFDGIKSEAGKLRGTELTYEGAGFADSSLVAGSLKRLLGKMNEILASGSSSKEDFALKLTYFFSEMFLLCPFRFGSLIAQAVFFHNFALSRGFDVNYDACGGARLCDAVRVAFLTDEPSELYMCLNDAISRVATVSDTGETVVLEIAQRELKRSGKPKTLIRAGSKKEKKSDKPKALKKAEEKTDKKTKAETKKKAAKKSAAEPTSQAAKTVQSEEETEKEKISAIADLTELSSDTLKKAAKLKEKIEQLQRQLSELLTPPAPEVKAETAAAAEKEVAPVPKLEPIAAPKKEAAAEKPTKRNSKKADKIELSKIKTDGLSVPSAKQKDKP